MSVHRGRRLPPNAGSQTSVRRPSPLGERGSGRRTGVPSGALRARAILLVAVVLAAVAAGAGSAAPFAPRVSLNVHGDVTMAANTVLTCPAADPACAAAQAGGPGQNNGFAMTRVDADGAPSTFDSSRRHAQPAARRDRALRGPLLGGQARRGGGRRRGPGPVGGQPRPAGRAARAAYVAVAGATTGTATVAGGAGYQAFADVTALVAAGGAGSYSRGQRPGRHRPRGLGRLGARRGLRGPGPAAAQPHGLGRVPAGHLRPAAGGGDDQGASRRRPSGRSARGWASWPTTATAASPATRFGSTAFRSADR